MGFKKIVINSFNEKTGNFEVKETITLRHGINSTDFEMAKASVQKIILTRVISKKKFTVSWNRNGFEEGYLVSL